MATEEWPWLPVSLSNGHADHVSRVGIGHLVAAAVVGQVEHVVLVDQEFAVSEHATSEAAGDAVDPVGEDGNAGVDRELAVGRVVVVPSMSAPGTP